MSCHWHEKLDRRGNLWLGLDYADGPVNLLAGEVFDELDMLLMDIKRAPPAGLIIHSLKDRGFVAGADIGEFVGVGEAAAVAERIRRVHGILDRLEALPCASVALIRGFCLGGGLELSLACRYRVASDDPDTLLGLPEVRLGLFPGYGGTWRSVRTLGALPAMHLMLTGRSLGPRDAARLGLVDRVAPRRQLAATALDLLETQPASRRSAWTQRLLNHWPFRPLAAGLLERRTAQRVQRDHYPAPFALIEHWRQCGANRRALLVSEAKQVAQLLTGDRAQNLIRVFRLQERLKGLGRPPGFVPRRVHLVGAGVMGGDIAAWCALHGQGVTLQDLSRDQLARAMKRAYTLFERRLPDPHRVRDAWDRLMPDPRGEGLERADLVIEAIVENIDAKRRLLADIEARVDGDTLLATNTSSIPLETLEQGMKRPQRLLGLHFFNPLARMRLVEVVHGPSTGAETLRRGLSFVSAIERLPLPVRSSPGFLVNRVLTPYLLEAMHLLEEGVSAPAIDQAAQDFGMPMGPIELADAVGLDVCLAVAQILGARLTAPEETPPLLEKMVRDGLLGRKTGAGFYRYKNGRARNQRASRARRLPADLAERLIFRLLNEAVACLREGVVEDADLLDAAVIFGIGFAPFRGGPMHYIDESGRSRMLGRLESLQHRHGGRFQPDQGWKRLRDA